MTTGAALIVAACLGNLLLLRFKLRVMQDLARHEIHSHSQAD